VSKKYVLAIIGLLTVVLSYAQSGKIAGKVLNQKNEPLQGVSVKIAGSQGGTTTDLEGRFSITIGAGKSYELSFTAVGYAAKTINEVDVTANQVNELTIVMERASKSLGEVTVTATRSARRETTSSLIQFQKNTNTVAAVVSAEAISRSPDRNTGEVLKRIPGASIQEGKYLILRGLSDRYNQAMLNGIQLSSTEPDRKTFSFDIFPSAMIDNIIINKAFVPEMTGEWAGGLVQINTKDIPSQSFFNVQVGTGFNTQTLGKDYYTYAGGKLDWLGMDDGARALPDNMPFKNSFKGLSLTQKTEWGKQFGNNWTVSEGNAPIDASLQISGGFNTTLFKKKFGGVIALTYASRNRRLQFDNNFFNITDIGNGVKQADTIYAYHNTRYSKNILWGGLANFALQLNNNHKISIKNIFNVNATDYTALRDGNDYEFGAPIKARELGFRSNTLFNTQLTGEHNFGSLQSKLKWYGSFTILDQYIPKQRRLQYNLNGSTGNYEALLGEVRSQRSGSIFYSNLSDYIYSAGGDWSTTFDWLNHKQTVKAGYLFQVKDRLYNSRPFSILLPSTSDHNLLKLSEDEIFAEENFGGNGFYFDEYGESNFRYLANSILNAGYLQLDNQFADWLRVVWGVRVEDFDQLIGSVDKNDPRHVNTRVTDFLPAVNATFKLNNLTNIRLSGSQTVIRPEFRELSDFAFYDFELGATVVGNRNLKRTKVTNLDLRYELYPRAGEMFTVGVFYKHFDDPIEQMFNQTGAGGSSSFNFINADEATDYGAELEFRKKLDFVNGLKNFTFQTNLSYIYSEVKSEQQDLDRPLQGQSPYVVNVGLQYDLEKIGLNTTILYNQIGRRILYVGNQDYPEIWEAPRPLLDLQIAKKIIKKKGELRLNVSDIINKKAYFYHNLDNKKDFKSNSVADAISIRRNYGTNVSLTFGYNF
jgi:outer membrane receptor protein involved in Fe transport